MMKGFKSLSDVIMEALCKCSQAFCLGRFFAGQFYGKMLSFCMGQVQKK